jgi:hypothetical protein
MTRPPDWDSPDRSGRLEQLAKTKAVPEKTPNHDQSGPARPQAVQRCGDHGNSP